MLHLPVSLALIFTCFNQILGFKSLHSEKCIKAFPAYACLVNSLKKDLNRLKKEALET